MKPDFKVDPASQNKVGFQPMIHFAAPNYQNGAFKAQ